MYLFTFKKMSAKYPNVNNYVYLSFCQVKMDNDEVMGIAVGTASKRIILLLRIY